MPTQSLVQINRRIDKLKRDAERIRKKEVAGVIARIKVAIREYGITAADIGLGSGVSRKAHAKRDSRAKYGDGKGRTWTGHGRRPQWFIDALAAGKTADEMRV
jgi:DNA-binding protein H-NS